MKKFGLLCMMLVLFPLFSHADVGKDMIVDRAGIFGNEISEVKNAAENLMNVGADVRVWTTKSYSQEARNLDAYFNLLLNMHPAWQSPAGGKKSNLVVFVIAMKERETGLYYGGDWDGPLSSWQRIIADYMNPKFKQGRFAEGFVSGINETKRLIYNHLHPQSQTRGIIIQDQTGSEVARETSDGGPSKIIIKSGAPSQPTDYTGLWNVLMWIVILGFIITASLFIASFIVSHKKAKERRLEAQQKAKIQKTNAIKRIATIREIIAETNTLVFAVANQVDEETSRNLGEDFYKLKIDGGALSSNFSATSSSVGDPEVEGLSEAQYSAIEQKFGEISKASDAIEASANHLKIKVTGLRDAIIKSPKDLEDIAGFVANIQETIETMKKDGFKTGESAGFLAEAMSIISQAKKVLEEKKYLLFSELMLTAHDKIVKAKNSVLSLRELKQVIDQRIDDLQKKRIPDAVEKIADGRYTFEYISKTFAPTSWETIVGNGTEAENRICWSNDAIESAKGKAGMDEQDWQGAGELLDKVDHWLDQIESYMRSISTLVNNLEQARNNVAGEISDAESDIRKAWTYIKNYDDDIRDSLENDLRRAENIIAETKEKLKADRPDYILAYKKAQEANALADKVYDEAVDEHEAAERLRRKATSQLQTATSAISRAKEYIEDHNSDVENDAKTLLSKAKGKLTKARETADLNGMIILAEAAEKEANRAYKLAKTDVDNATSYDYTSSTPRSWGSSSRTRYSSSSSTTISGGGGSIGFGGGGGGGGSIGFGGGGGGGGSAKW